MMQLYHALQNVSAVVELPTGISFSAQMDHPREIGMTTMTVSQQVAGKTERSRPTHGTNTITMAKHVTPFRVLALIPAALAAAGAYLFAGPFWWPVSIAFGSLSILCIWFSVRGDKHCDRLLIIWGIVSGCCLGGLGLVVGILGSIYLWPKSNLAPILGVFVSGPYAFAAGIVIGIVVRLILNCKGVKPVKGSSP
jgi:hypothetical protein